VLAHSVQRSTTQGLCTECAICPSSSGHLHCADLRMRAQDICAPGGSQARNAVEVEGDETSGTCSPYPRFCAEQRRTSFAIPSAMFALTAMDVEVTVSAFGSHAPVDRPDERVEGTWWCHKYRKRRDSDHGRPSVRPSPRRLQRSAAVFFGALRGAAGTCHRAIERSFGVLQLPRRPPLRKEEVL